MARTTTLLNFAKAPEWISHLNIYWTTQYLRSKLFYVISYRSISSNYKSDVIVVDKYQKYDVFLSDNRNSYLLIICEVRQLYIKTKKVFKEFNIKIQNGVSLVET